MKRMGIFLLIAVLWSISAGLTLNYHLTDTETVISGIDTTNALTWKARLDSIAANLSAHQVRGSIHVKSDETTALASILDCSTVRKTIRSLNNIRTQLITHLAQDSVHVGPCITAVPDELSEDASFSSAVSYATDLLTAYDTHYAHTYNTRHRLIAKLFDAAALAHAAKDTSDASDVHFFPDTVYTTASVDTTNADSTRASLIRLASRWNAHVKNTYWHNSSSNDTISASLASPTTVYGDQLLANALISAYNTHVGTDRSSLGYPAGTAVHWVADTNLLAVADVVHGGHLVADTGGSAKSQAYQEYVMPYYEENTLYFTGSSVTSGATFYIYGSADGSNWFKAETFTVVANGTFTKTLTTWYPYLKVTCPERKDGTYTVKMIGAK